MKEKHPDRVCSAEAKWHTSSTKIFNSGNERGQDSPNRLARVGDRTSSHSSSNTLSSSASSSNSDENHFGSGDLIDQELLGITYIKGASTDSGIDTTPCCAAVLPTGNPLSVMAHVVVEDQAAVVWGHTWAREHPENRDERPVQLYPPQSYIMTRHKSMEGSMLNLRDLSSHNRQLYLVEAACHIQEGEIERGKREQSDMKKEHAKVILTDSLPGEEICRKSIVGFQNRCWKHFEVITSSGCPAKGEVLAQERTCGQRGIQSTLWVTKWMWLLLECPADHIF
ncbi:signal-induced proliferation-associated 1-like protein 2 isoform X4 [Tachysurus ichikawai]